MFSWLSGLFGNIFSSLGGDVVNAIWDNLIKWLLTTFYDALSDLFTTMGTMGAEIFDLTWVESTVYLFYLFGWVLYGVGIVVAVFDLAIEFQNGRATVKSTAINVLKGFFAAYLVTSVPVELYKFCMRLLLSIHCFQRRRILGLLRFGPGHRQVLTDEDLRAKDHECLCCHGRQAVHLQRSYPDQATGSPARASIQRRRWSEVP